MASDGAVEGTRTYPITVLGDADAGEILTLQRAACVTEAQAHRDVNLPPLTQTFEELRAELSDPDVTALGVRERGRLIAAVRLRRTGTSVRFLPDLEIFSTGIEFDYQTLSARLRELAYLNGGVKIVFRDERPNARSAGSE